ncbi:MAG: serine/threonine-protein kinase [Sulfuricellaceae bacterium]
MKKPAKLGKYEIRQELGRGAMGIVYEAFDPLIERNVAIKTILKSSIDKSEVDEAFKRFRREARAAGRLSHPKIVAIYEYGEDDDMAFIVMELIRGKELKELFDHEESFSINDGLRIVLQILDALDYSHARGVVHRDIKPANILITDDGKIKIADFGIAKIDSSSLTQVGVVLGTPTYMSPEQFMGNKVDKRADIYSAGVILYQFLTGVRPFIGGVISIMHQVVNKEATPPSTINRKVSVELDEVVKKAMAKRPEDRFQSAAEFMGALKVAAQAVPVMTPPDSGADHTIADLHKAFDSDDTIKLPGRAKPADTDRKNDIASWQRITNSQSTADFYRYLQDFPNGEFVQLAQVRIESLEKAAAQTRDAAERARLEQAAQARSVLAEEKRKKAELKAAAEKARAQAEAHAEAEAKRQQESAEKALWAQKIAEIKNEAEAARAAEAARREREAAERARRAETLSVSLSKRADKFVEAVSKREAIVEAEHRLMMESKKKLTAEVERKKQAKMKLISKKETAEVQSCAPAEENLQRETSHAEWQNELNEANAHAADSEDSKMETEAGIALAQKRTRFLILIVAALLSVLLLGVLIALFPAG